MIQFSTLVAHALTQPVVESFFMVKIGSSYRTTSHFTDVTLSNGETFLADGRLMNVDSPRLSATVDREIYKVSIADSDFVMGTLAESNLVGAEFEVRIGFIDPDTGHPITLLSDTLLSYKGIIDTPGYSISTSNIGENILQISGASPMADLDATRTYYGSRDFIRSIAPDDSSFDQIYEGSGTVNLKWGKG